MTDRLTAEDAARLLEGTTLGPWRQEPSTAAGRVWVRVGPQSFVSPTDIEPLFNVRTADEYAQRERDARLVAAAPALAAALADSVQLRPGEQTVRVVAGSTMASTPEDVHDTVMCLGEPDAVEAVRKALAEVARLREALRSHGQHLWTCRAKEWVTDPRGGDAIHPPCDCGLDAALAEGSDVLPTQRDH